MTTDRLRQSFLSYFEKRGHKVVKSSSLVPHNDPTLLFTNAGMNQFKHVFTGADKRDYKRAVSCQKCMRAGGKHNDLENVGYTARHHTFFEMLGNFSFGDYFKKEAITFGWEFVTVDLGLDPLRLWITVYKDDDEAFKLWRDLVKIPATKILKLGEKDNFWAMGDTGPCGPCSEIHYDNGPSVGCGKKDCSPACDCGRFVELWNLVFMEFEKDEKGKMTKLPRPSIDTGMGLERVAAVKQGVLSNYDTDIFRPIIKGLCEISSREYGKDDESTVSMRAIADHARALTFLICEGVVPSNEGRGYVLRRIVRRAARHGHIIGIKEPFVYKLVDPVVTSMGNYYTELAGEAESVKTILKNEEESFLKTSERGIEILEEEVKKLKKKGTKSKLFPGAKAFDLYSTYGFPLDLTQDALKKYRLKVDTKAFEKAFEEHREKAKDPSVFKKDASDDLVKKDLPRAEKLDEGTLRTAANLFWWNKDPRTGMLNLNFGKSATFYAESGGQIGDRGRVFNDNFEFEVVSNVKTPSGATVTIARPIRGDMSKLKEGAKFNIEVNEGLRFATMRNHTATHLLHKALRKILGAHVKQSGSLVEPFRFRFDFSHTGAIPKDVLRKIEDEVNSAILADLFVEKKVMPIDQAKKLGAMALFGEKYGEKVRVIKIKEKGGKGDYSIELCGGTHVDRTGEIGTFKILSEASIASGMRRIEAVTGDYAVREYRKTEDLLSNAAEILKCRPEEVLARLERTVSRAKELEKKIADGSAPDLRAKSDEMLKNAKDMGGFKVISAEASVENPRNLRALADQMLDRIKNGIVVLGTKNNEKAFLVAKVSKELSQKFSAKVIIQDISKIIGGGGGGKEEIAEAGGNIPDKLEEALSRVFDIILSK